MTDFFLKRIRYLREILSLKKGEAYFTSKSEDVLYLTGFNSSNSNLIITNDSEKILLIKDILNRLKI